MSIDPRIWGKHFWFMMYSIALVYPHNPTREDKKNTKHFYSSLGPILPCEKCRRNFNDHIKHYPITDTVFANRSNLVTWVININNEVNKSTGGKIVTYNDIIKEYSIKLNPNNISKPKKYSHIYIIIVILVIGTYILYYRFNNISKFT